MDITEDLKNMRFIRRLHIYIPWGIGLVFVLLLLTKLIPLGMPGHWTWFYRNFDVFMLSPLMIVLGIITGVGIITTSNFQKRIGTRLTLLLLSVLIVFMNLVIHKPLHLSWTLRALAITSREINPYFNRSQEITSIRRYPEEHVELMKKGYWALPTYYRRLSTYPPGIPIIYFSVGKLANLSPPVSNMLGDLALHELSDEEQDETLSMPQGDSAASAGLSIIFHLLVLALIPLSVYLLTSVLSDEGAGVQAAAASCLVPAFHLFASTPDIMLTTLCTFAVYFSVRALKTNSATQLFFAGLLMSLCLFMSFSCIPIIFLCVLTFLLANQTQPGRKARMLSTWLAGILAGCITPLLVRYNTFATLFTALKNNREFYTGSGRLWPVSTFSNFIEFSIFAGLIWALAYYYCFGKTAYGLIEKRERNLPGKLKLSHAFCAALGITLILVLFSGSVRGEVARNCMHLMPLLVSALFCRETFTQEQFAHLGSVSLIIVLLMTSMIQVSFGFWS